MSVVDSPPVFRFAPSPNGALHLGHAYSALLNDELARVVGGEMLLRIEDIDVTRCTPELEAAMLADLEWLGIGWELPVRRQSAHFETYREALSHLDDMGLVYRSHLSRGDVRRIVERAEAEGATWPRDPDGAPLFPGRGDEDHASGTDTHTVRLDMAAAVERVGALTWTEFDRTGKQCKVEANPGAWGDVVLARRDVPVSYHLAVTVDDALQGVSHIVRGKDLYHASSVHRLLQVLLDLPQPIYHHHKLILDDDGKKLSKSNDSTSLQSLKSAGVTALQIRQKLGFGD